MGRREGLTFEEQDFEERDKATA